jgi:drug/metabolite transporter (DMT)-like permease
VGPLLSTGTLLGAAVWALGAVVLPLLVRGRGAVRDLLAGAVWASAVALATAQLAAGAGGHVHGAPRGLVLGALLAVAAAVGARALRGPV